MGKSKAKLKVKKPTGDRDGVVAKRASKPVRVKAKGGDGDTPKKVSTLVDRVRRRKRDALRKHRVSKANTPNGTNLHDIAEEPLDDILADSGGGGLTISLTITAGPSRHLSVDDGSSGDSGLPSKD